MNDSTRTKSALKRLKERTRFSPDETGLNIMNDMNSPSMILIDWRDAWMSCGSSRSRSRTTNLEKGAGL
jgi:hypothetical protein